MMRLKNVGSPEPKRFAFIATLESVVGALAGAFGGTSTTAEDRLLSRAANDAAQR